MTPLTSVLVFIFAVGAVGGIEQVNQGIHRPANIQSERDEWRDVCRDENLAATDQDIEECIDFAIEYGDI